MDSQPWPHRNVVIGKKSTMLYSIARRLHQQPKVSFDGYPKNKYVTKYNFGIKVLKLCPAYVYYLKLCFADGLTVYKIGFTSMTVRRRIDFFGLHSSTKVEILETIRCKSSKEAFYIEQLLHRKFLPYRYHGPALISSGNTELYTRAVL